MFAIAAIQDAPGHDAARTAVTPLSLVDRFKLPNYPVGEAFLDTLLRDQKSFASG
jgi:hypothetical protein